MVTTDLTKEELVDMPELEIAYYLLGKHETGLKFQVLFEEIANYKGFSADERQDVSLQLYMDLNKDERFQMLYSDIWTVKKQFLEQEDDNKAEENERSPYCSSCKSYLSSSTHKVCDKCNAYKCHCGSCLC